MTPKTAYIGLGSNLGDRRHNLERARDLLGSCGRVIAMSSIIETKAWGPVPQGDYLNAVVALETELTARDLLDSLHDLEHRLGRLHLGLPRVRFGPRTIDLDLLVCGDEQLEDGVEVPHPRLHERLFVLVPLAELAPGLRHPRLGKTIGELLVEATTSGS